MKRLRNICFCSLLENLDRSPLNNAWKIYNFKKEKWYIFYTKKAAEKEKWMKAFKEERRRVSEDAKTGKEESHPLVTLVDQKPFERWGPVGRSENVPGARLSKSQ